MSNTSGQSGNTTYTGIVKWFSNKLGYGFIRVVSEGDRHNDDIFVHQSRVTPNVSEYRTLRKGEYVQLEIMPDEKKTWQANNVTGVCGGPLLCDTYHRPRGNRNQQSTDESTAGSESQSNQ